MLYQKGPIRFESNVEWRRDVNRQADLMHWETQAPATMSMKALWVVSPEDAGRRVRATKT